MYSPRRRLAAVGLVLITLLHQWWQRDELASIDEDQCSLCPPSQRRSPRCPSQRSFTKLCLLARRRLDDNINLPQPRPIHDPSEAGDWEEGGSAFTNAEDDKLPRWFLELNVAGFEPDLNFYNNFIQEASKKGDLKAAERWLKNAEKAKVEPGKDTLTFLFEAASKFGDLEAAAQYAVQATEMGAVLDESLLADLLRVAAAEENLEIAEVLFSLCRNIPDALTYEALLLAAANRGNLESGERWLKRTEVVPSMDAVRRLMNAAASVGNLSMTERFFESGTKAGLVPDLASFNILIKAASSAGVPEAAEYWFEQAAARGLKPSLVTYTTLIKSAARAGDLASAEEWLQLAAQQAKREPRLQLDIQIFTAVIDAAARMANLSAAESWFRRATSQGLQPTLVFSLSQGRSELFCRSSSLSCCQIGEYGVLALLIRLLIASQDSPRHLCAKMFHGPKVSQRGRIGMQCPELVVIVASSQVVLLLPHEQTCCLPR